MSKYMSPLLRFVLFFPSLSPSTLPYGSSQHHSGALSIYFDPPVGVLTYNVFRSTYKRCEIKTYRVVLRLRFTCFFLKMSWFRKIIKYCCTNIALSFSHIYTQNRKHHLNSKSMEEAAIRFIFTKFSKLTLIDVDNISALLVSISKNVQFSNLVFKKGKSTFKTTKLGQMI